MQKSYIIGDNIFSHWTYWFNVECRTGNVELRSFVLVLFGNICACYKNRDQLNDLKNLYQMAEFLPSTFIISCSTFDIQKSYPFNVLYLITFLYCTRRIVNHSINIKLLQELQSTRKFKWKLSFITIRCIASMQKNTCTTSEIVWPEYFINNTESYDYV